MTEQPRKKSKSKKPKEKAVEKEDKEPVEVENEDTTKDKRKSEKEKKPKKEKKSDKSEKKEPEIDTKGKEIKHPPGGKLLFQCLEAKDVAKKPISMVVHVDMNDREVYKSKPTKGDKWQFEGRPEFLQCQQDDTTVVISLYEKQLVGTKAKGQITTSMDTLYSGYPFDQWFELTKEGKDENGSLHIRLQYIPPDKEPRHDEFKYPLHSLIHQNRLDLFNRKLEEMKSQSQDSDGNSFLNKEDEKKTPPLLLAASLGRPGFFKLLVEAGATVDVVDSDGRNCAHIAAINGNSKIISYLAYHKSSLLSQEDKDKRTPLHLAAINNHGDVITELIEAGVNVNATDAKNDTPLTAALLVEGGSASAITALVQGGADLYAKNTMHGVPAWEMATNKEICYATTSRNAFLKACDVLDPREFEIAQKFPKKKRIEGKSLGTNWETATQFILTAEKATKVSLLVYSKTRTDDSVKQVAFCVVKNSRNERKYKMPSFQQEGMGFGSTKPFECIIEPDLSYNLMSYCTKEELNGDFLLCIFTAADACDVSCVEAEDWPHHASLSSNWKKDTAAGSGDSFRSNPSFNLSVTKDAEVLIMVKQAVKDVAGVLLPEGGQHRIVPSKFYVGFYIMADNAEYDKTEKWVNSYDVYKFLDLKAGTTYTIFPCTQKEGQELGFQLMAFSKTKLKLEAE